MASYIFGGDTEQTAESIARRREIAKALLEGSMYAAPQNVGEGLTAIGAAIGGRLANRRADKAEEAGRTEAMSSFQQNLPFWLQSSMGGTSAPSAPPSSPSQPTRSSAPSMGGRTQNWADAIASIESAGSGDYAAVGPTHPKMGRALGRYQVMESNIGPWSREALGREVTPQEFMANPAIQDAIFNHQFGGYVEKYGSPEQAASMWFTGQPIERGAHREDVLGTSGSEYVSKFSAALGRQPSNASEAIEMVTGGGMVNDPAALGPARYAPGMAPQPAPAPAPPQQPAFNPLMQRRDQLAQQTGSQQIAQADPSRGFLAAILGGGQGGQPSGGEFPPAPSPDGLDAMRGPQLPFDPAMLELANNPFLPEGQRAVLQSMIQQQMQAADPMRRLEMQRAQLELEQLRNPDPRDIINAGDGRLYNPNTGEWITAPGGSTEPPEIQKFYDENGMEVYRQWNPQTGEWDQVGGAKAPSGMNLSVDSEGNIRFTQGDIGAAGRNEGTLGKELSKADAALLTTARESATAAEDLNSLANQLDAVVNDVGYTGPGGGIYGAVDDAIRILPGDEAARGAFRSLAMEAQLTFTAKTKGAITDREMSMFRQAVPNLSQTPAGNEEIIKVIQAGADRVRKRADFYEQFLSQNGSLQGAQAAWGRFIDQNPIISEGADGSLMLNETQSFEPYLDPDYRGTAEKREPVRIDGYTIEEVD